MTNQGYYNYMWRTLSTGNIKGIGKTVFISSDKRSLVTFVPDQHLRLSDSHILSQVTLHIGVNIAYFKINLR